MSVKRCYQTNSWD